MGPQDDPLLGRHRCDERCEQRRLARRRGAGDDHVASCVPDLVDEFDTDDVGERVERPLSGLKVACYYGCLITRPAGVTAAENPEYPQRMDRLIRSLGSRTVDWSRKTDCCGGSLAISKTGAAKGLIRRILEDARASGAEAIVTMCPICHLNLDSRQDDPRAGLPGFDRNITKILV